MSRDRSPLPLNPLTPTQRAALNATVSSGPDHDDEAKHFIVCADCGQAIDCRNLGDVFHHEEPGHEPIGAPQ